MVTSASCKVLFAYATAIIYLATSFAKPSCKENNSELRHTAKRHRCPLSDIWQKLKKASLNGRRERNVDCLRYFDLLTVTAALTVSENARNLIVSPTVDSTTPPIIDHNLNEFHKMNGMDGQIYAVLLILRFC